MATITLVTSVFLSKAEALAVLEDTLSSPWNTDDPGDVTLSVGDGAVLSIEVPKFGEDLPLTLDIHHDDPTKLREITDSIKETVTSTLGWSIHEIP